MTSTLELSHLLCRSRANVAKRVWWARRECGRDCRHPRRLAGGLGRGRGQPDPFVGRQIDVRQPVTTRRPRDREQQRTTRPGTGQKRAHYFSFRSYTLSDPAEAAVIATMAALTQLTQALLC